VTYNQGVGLPLPIYEEQVKSILSPTSGFIAQAGFTHSLNPARNCTYGCTYCYVPTMRVHGGLRQREWERWGQFTTFKSNAPALLAKALRPAQVIYCSPLVDPYQPAEAARRMMPELFAALIRKPPAVITIQTRSPLVIRDLELLKELAGKTRVRVSFSLTTDMDEVRRIYEPHCESLEERLQAVAALRNGGIKTFATLAPILPCNPERLARLALEATENDVLGDPFHERSNKPAGAVTRPQAEAISRKHGYEEWHEPGFQARIAGRMAAVVRESGRKFAIGPEAFSWLAQ